MLVRLYEQKFDFEAPTCDIATSFRVKVESVYR